MEENGAVIFQTLGYQSLLATSSLMYFVRVLSDLQAWQNRTAHHLSEVKGMCHVTSKLTNICDRMESSKQQWTKAWHPYYSQIWLTYYHDWRLEEARSACNYCYSQHPGRKSFWHRERCDRAPLLPISFFISASVESPHLCGNPMAITDRLNATLLGPDSMSLLGFPFYIYLFFSAIYSTFSYPLFLNYSHNQSSV